MKSIVESKAAEDYLVNCVLKKKLKRMKINIIVLDICIIINLFILIRSIISE